MARIHPDSSIPVRRENSTAPTWKWAGLAAALLLIGCGGNDINALDGDANTGGTGNGTAGAGNAGNGNGGSAFQTPIPRGTVDADYLNASTISARVGLPLTPQGTMLSATNLVNQLAAYDPGSLLRCELGAQAAYDTAIDDLGGVTWGYGIGVLEDQSKPRILAGFQDYDPRLLVPTAAGAGDAAGPAVEIALPDIVAVTDSAALFYSNVHGLMVVDIADGVPSFKCATQIPGQVDQFYFHQDHLIAMTKGVGNGHSQLLHFQVAGTQLTFVEAVDLGQVNILDSRRFNDKLVFYTDLHLGADTAPAQPNPVPPNGGAGVAVAEPVYIPPAGAEHRALRVYTLGDTLQEEMHDTLIDTTLAQDQLVAEQAVPGTPVDTLLNESRRFGQSMWASDHYFVITEEVSKTYLASWESNTYSVCTASHTIETPYRYCWTEYETRPNPDYVEPDNSGGDRACQGTTLSDCLVQVARVANKTIQVPIGQQCEDRINSTWVCDSYEQRTTEYPLFRYEQSTQLYIYEYTDTGFVRVDSTVHEITTPGLENQSPDATIDVLNTSADTFELAVPGAIQTLYFQNGFLYVISQGVLQVYAMGGSSIVRTSTLQVVNEELQSSLFSDQQLILSDFGWNGGDHSTLRVVNLANPGFPTVEAMTHSLPGGHRSILLSQYGVFTIGAVSQFMGQQVNAIKLGLFSDPYVEEKAYLILGTDLTNTYLGEVEAQFFNSAQQRLALPYSGQDEANHGVLRIGMSHVEADSIVSEGAVVVPEPVQRVRPVPGTDEAYLSFASNSIEWLTPQAPEWTSSPVLEYFQPSQVYRLNDDDDYVEIDRLGGRCKLYFANAADINQRATGNYSEEFECYGGYAVAYGNILLFGDTGIEFNPEDFSVRALSEDEVVDVNEAIAARPYCLLSLDLVMNTYVDPNEIPNDAEATCMSAEEYSQRQNELLNPETP
jgi:hypothetical protein